MRVERRNPISGELQSYWLDTLTKGACFSVFNCFENTKSLVNFYASSKSTIIDQIHIDDLLNLGKDIQALSDRLDIIKLRIQNKLVDDIDYFTFPMRFLEQLNEQKTELTRKLDWQRYC